MSKTFASLKERLGTVVSLGQAAALLEWDMQTQMPPGGGEARARHLSTLQKLRHEIFTADETGTLLSAAEKEAGSPAYESDEASLLRVARRDYDKEKKIPATLVGELG
ncbi:MAG: carboxypeptidase M32, partial [Spirochaetia bacterium]|nr:carboxypeptidase M32 [Spirochaetia bacterium]